MRKTAVFVVVVAASVLVADVVTLGTSARAQDWDPCSLDSEPNSGIRGCTAAIREGIAVGQDLALVYYYRGRAHHRLGQYRRAIQDYGEALLLDPEVYLYYYRGLAYQDLGQYHRAMQDYDQALLLDPSHTQAKQSRSIALKELDRRGKSYRRPSPESVPKAPTGPDRETVLSAQRMLAQLGLYDAGIDGIVGPKTRQAVRQFQKQWGYPVTGEINQRLLGQLEAATKVAAAIADEEQSRGTESAGAREAERPEIQSTGTGFYVDAAGSILTNAHVVEGCSALTVGDDVSAKLIAEAGEADLALLRTDPNAAHGVARFSARPARLNADLTVIGFPLHGLLGGLNVTRGAVSSTSGIGGDDDYFQMTAAVQPGNSGGPVVNEFGAVIGVVVGKLDAIEIAKAIGDIPQNVNFAIRGELAKLFLNKHGIDFEINMNQTRLQPAALAEDAGNYTVLISCWGG